MTDRIVDSLTAMGFELRLQEGVGYLFDFGYYSFAYMLSDDNERLIRIVVTHFIQCKRGKPIGCISGNERYLANNQLRQTDSDKR